MLQRGPASNFTSPCFHFASQTAGEQARQQEGKLGKQDSAMSRMHERLVPGWLASSATIPQKSQEIGGAGT
jgi:hypothetical protein